MSKSKTADQLIAEYALSHQNPVNKLCHTVGIPLIVLSLPLFAIAPFWPGLWLVPLTMFLTGWILQFAGHAVERKPPEFMKDWRFLFIGMRWWLAKMRGKV